MSELRAQFSYYYKRETELRDKLKSTEKFHINVFSFGLFIRDEWRELNEQYYEAQMDTCMAVHRGDWYRDNVEKWNFSAVG